jgi:cyclopropane fatty-acyl-phospholipid synthase-like methyltransferase
VSEFIPIPIIKDIVKRYDLKSILDLGCGSAEFLLQVCESTDLNAFGVDISKDAIQYAQQGINSRGLSNKIVVKVGDIFNLNTFASFQGENRVDAVTSMFVVHEFAYSGQARLIELLKVIKKSFPESYLILCEFSRFSSDFLRERTSSIAEHHLFHALSEQGILTPQEWRHVISESGYGIVEEIRYDFAGQIYFILK